MRFLGSSRSRRTIAVTGVGALAALGLTACIPPPGGGNSETFECTGDAQTWTVPPGVTQATFELLGAQGGTGDGGSLGGLGGKATLSGGVTPGTEMQVNVGCSGDSEAGSPGFNGGGTGGDLLLGGGGPGGGQTDVRVPTDSGLIPFLIAGGGGGGGCSTALGTGGVGGTGGGTEGTAGEDGKLLDLGPIGLVGGGGGAGTQIESGFGGDGSERGLLDGGPGDPFQGGNGGGTLLICGGGGGGGGLFGGGGGGSSLLGGGGGGGGSGAGVPGSPFTLEPGVQEGDGQVTISW
jgi:hypothetical protein